MYLFRLRLGFIKNLAKDNNLPLIKNFFSESELENLKRNLNDELEDFIEHDLTDNWAEEDSISGALTRAIRQGFKKTNVSGYRVTCKSKKLRGRGKNAPELKSGTDIAMTITIADEDSKSIQTKTLPIQIKKNKFDKRGFDQLRNMQNTMNTGAGLIIKENELKISDAEDLLRGNQNSLNLPDYIADRFLACVSGKKGLIFNETSEEFEFISQSINRLDILYTRGDNQFESRIKHLIDCERNTDHLNHNIEFKKYYMLLSHLKREYKK